MVYDLINHKSINPGLTCNKLSTSSHMVPRIFLPSYRCCSIQWLPGIGSVLRLRHYRDISRSSGDCTGGDALWVMRCVSVKWCKMYRISCWKSCERLMLVEFWSSEVSVFNVRKRGTISWDGHRKKLSGKIS